MNRIRIAVSASACVGTLAVTALATLPSYVVTDLGTLDGPATLIEPGSAAWSIGPGQSIVGLSIDDGPVHNLRGFRRTPTGLLVKLAPFGDDVHSTAFAVNASHEAVGVSYVLGALSPHAIRWAADGSATVLGDGAARDINAAGAVAGSIPVSNAPGVTHAARWAGGVVSDLGTLGGPHSSAMAINDSGWIVGESLLANVVTTRGFVHTGGSMKALTTLGGPRSHAMDINASNVVVGIAWTAGAQPHAVRWTLDGAGNVIQTLDLGLLPGATSSAAYAISNMGEIVGTSNDRAVRWAGAGGGAPTDLNGQIAPDSGWDLRTATAVDDAGRIVGTGRHVGRGRAYLLTPRASTDLNADGVTDGADLGLLLAGFGTADPDLDLDGNGVVDGGDLGLLLAGWSGG